MVTHSVAIPKASGSSHAGLTAGKDLYEFDRQNQVKRWFRSGEWNDGREVKPKVIKVTRTKITKYDHKAHCARMFERAKRNNPKLGELNGNRGKAGNS